MVPQTALQYHIRNVAIYGMKNSSMGSGTDVRNSDIGDLADFSSDEEESQVEQISGCPIAGCQCEGSIDRSGVTFDVELCIPWDAPEAVVDINSAEVVTLGSLPDKVGLFGRRKDAAVSRILQGRDSRIVRFLVPDARGDVTIVDMDDEREPMVTPADMKRLRDL